MARCILSLAHRTGQRQQCSQAKCKGTHTTRAVQHILSDAENFDYSRSSNATKQLTVALEYMVTNRAPQGLASVMCRPGTTFGDTKHAYKVAQNGILVLFLPKPFSSSPFALPKFGLPWFASDTRGYYLI